MTATTLVRIVLSVCPIMNSLLHEISLFLQNDGSKKTSQRTDSDEEAHASKRDETDRSVVMFKPMVSDPIHIHRKSPLPRSRKIGSGEVSVAILMHTHGSIKLLFGKVGQFIFLVFY